MSDLVINKMITNKNRSISNRGVGKIKYLVKHYVGATGGALANCKHFRDTYIGASAHYFVGHNGENWQCVEDKDVAWHVGAKRYKHRYCRNSNSIGVELCVRKDASGRWYYTEATKKAAIELFAYLMKKYNIPISNVLRHYDVTGKICPEPDVLSAPVWDTFKTELLLAVNGSSTSESQDIVQGVIQDAVSTSSVPYRIKVANVAKGDVLWIRKTPSAVAIRIGYLKCDDNNVYTIVAEQNGWGKLKSGIGWINLRYTKRV